MVDLEGDPGEVRVEGAETVRREGSCVWLRFDGYRLTASALIHRLSRDYAVRDLTVQEPELEEVIRRVYEHGAAAAARQALAGPHP